MALTLSSAARLANPNFGNIEQLGQDIGSLSARRRQRGMLTDLLSPLTDPMATSADYATAAKGLIPIDQGLGLQVAARGRTLAEEEKTKRDEEEEIRRKRGLQVSLQAITQGAMRGVPLSSDEKPDLRSVVKSVFDNQGTNQQIIDAYQAGIGKPREYDFSEETIMIGDTPTRVKVAADKTDPTSIEVQTIGKAVPSKTGSGDSKTLKQQLADAGIPKVDLTTLEGAKQARRDIIKFTGNASLANSVGQIIEDLTPLSIREGLEIVRSTNPEFVEAENLREKISRFTSLAELTDQDIAGLSTLIERTLTSTTENDIKAVSELERFRKAKDLVQRIKDFSLELTVGKLSDDTIKEYTTLAAAFDELAEMRMSRALDAMIVNGSPKESDAAQRAKNQILGMSQARIVPPQ